MEPLDGQVGIRVFARDADILSDKDYVVCTHAALARCGLTTVNPACMTVFTEYKELHNLDAGFTTFVYSEKINYRDFLIPIPNNPHLLLPTKERAIIESILHLDGVDEGELLEAIRTYLLMYGGETVKLYEMADFFGLAAGELDGWIREADGWEAE